MKKSYQIKLYDHTSLLKFIFQKISEIEKYNVLISGGNSLNYIYKKISLSAEIKKMNLYLSDERLSNDKIYLNSINLLQIFNNRLKNKLFLESIFNRKQKNDLIRSFVEDFKDKNFDLAILSIGNDGHIVSLFNEEGLKVKTIYKNFVLVKRLNEIYYRVGINLSFLKKIKNIIFFISKEKKNIINKIINEDFKMMPFVNEIIKNGNCVNFIIDD